MKPDVSEQLLARWREAWPQALAVWSQFTRLSDPRLCASTVAAAEQGLTASFAMIRLADQSVVIDLEAVQKLGLDDYAMEILAHEVGHHVLAPANASDHFRLLATIRKGLPTLEKHAAMVANLYTDLLINDRLQRQGSLRMHAIYQKLLAGQPAMTKVSVWALYMRIYERLWTLESGSLGVAVDDPLFESHSWLGARLVRVYANDWLTGGARFAALLLPYLHEAAEEEAAALERLHDTREAGLDCEPCGLVDYGDGELQDPIHPVEDPLINDNLDHLDNSPEVPAPQTTDANTPGRGQRREPFEYGEILRAAGLKLSDADMAVRYYREAALPYLIPFPKSKVPQRQEAQMEGLEAWELGDALDEIDWLASLSLSPHAVPGVTTMKRHYGLAPGNEPASKPIDLDIYVDSSGSMPNPQQRISYMALAGAVICLSALRSGSRVQATLWSGKNQFTSTQGFVRDEEAILRILTGHLGGATAFPIHKLRETFSTRAKHERDCHILHISDDGITTMFGDDERGNSGWEVAAQALQRGRAGGTMALNLWQDWQTSNTQVSQDLRRARIEQGWQIHMVNDLPQLLDFAREFSRRHYGERTYTRIDTDRSGPANPALAPHGARP